MPKISPTKKNKKKDSLLLSQYNSVKAHERKVKLNRKRSEERNYAVPMDQMAHGRWRNSDFDEYVSKTFPTPAHFFKKWKVEDVVSSYSDWHEKMNWTSMYIIANNHEKYNSLTYIGSVDNFELEHRFKQHNGELLNGPAETKRLHGHCFLIFYVTLPPFRNFTSEDMVNSCKARRGWKSRCQKAIELSSLKGVQFRISKKVFDKTSPFYSNQLVSQIQALFPTTTTEIPDDLFVETHLPNINIQRQILLKKGNKKKTKKAKE